MKRGSALLSDKQERMISISPIEVRIVPPQPPIHAFGQVPQETREWAGNPGFLRI
jgi:hypothetical protein